MFISGDVVPDKNNFQWVACVKNVTLKLSEPDGKKSIQIRFRDVSSKEFGDATASILLERSPPVIASVKLADGSGAINPAENVNLRIQMQVKAKEDATQPYQMHISGDVKNDIRTFSWVSYSKEIWVTLLKDKDSEKREVMVKLRARSGLESKPVTAVIRLVQPKGDGMPQTGEEPKDENPVPEDSMLRALSLLINGGENTTSSRVVKLSLKAENATEMYISGDVTNVGSDTVFRWRPYVPQIDVYLSTGDGTKIITVKFRDKDKQVSETLQSQILLDRRPPSAITSISTAAPSHSNGIYHAGELITIRVYQAEYNPSLTGTVKITSHIAAYHSGMLTLEAASGGFTTVWDTTGLKEATDYAIIASLSDTTGQQVTSAPHNITIDNTPPQIKHILFKDGKGSVLGKVTASSDISIQSDVSDAVTMLVEGDVTVQNWGEYTSPFAVQLTEGDGAKSILVKFKDKADNETQVKQTIVLAQNGPDISELDSYIEGNPLDNDEVYQPGGNVRIVVAALRGSPESELEIQGTVRIQSTGYDSGEQKLAFFGDSTPELTKFSYLWNTAQLPDANYTAHFTLTDNVGNQSPGDLVITLDTVPPGQPTLRINGGVPTTAMRIIGLKLSNEDATEVFVDGDVVRDDKTFKWVSFDTNALFGVTLLPSTGFKQIRVKYRDAAGNIGPSITGSIEYNPAKPIPATLVVNGGQTHTNVPKVTLTLIADGAAEMYISGDVKDGNKWIPFSTPANVTLSDGDGLKVLVAQFRNAHAQVIDSANANITLDATPPQIIAVSAIDSLDRLLKQQFAIGTPVLIQVTTEETNLVGTIRIISSLKHCDSGILPLQTNDADSLKTLWNTMGLKPAADYVVYVELEDTVSNKAHKDSLTLTLVPPIVGHRILINDGATFTDNRNVYLTMFSTNASEMYLEGDIEGEKVGEWIPYQHGVSASLSSGDNTKSVRVKYRNSVETHVAEATITLSENNPVIKQMEASQQTVKAGEIARISVQSEGCRLQGTLQIKSIATGYNSGWVKLDKESETPNSTTFSYIWNTVGLTEARDYVVSAEITDALKRTARSSLVLTIDNAPLPPSIQSVSISDAIDLFDNDGIYHTGQQLMVTIKTEDATSKLRASVTSTSSQHQLTAEPELTQIDWNIYKMTLDTTDMQEGDYMLNITIFDQRDRQASDTSQHILIDNTPPELILLIANRGDEITSKRTIPLKVKASDATQMRISLEGENPSWVSYNENLSITLSGDDGYKEINVFLRDAAKNEISAKTSVTLDAERPTVQKTAQLICSGKSARSSQQPYILVLSFSEPIKKVIADQFQLKLVEQTFSQTLLELKNEDLSSIMVEGEKVLVSLWFEPQDGFGGLDIDNLSNHSIFPTSKTLPIGVVVAENSAQDFSGKGNLSNQAQPASLTYTELNLLEQMRVVIDDELASTDSHIAISPNGDGKRDALNLFYTLNHKADVLLRIQNDKRQTVAQSVHQGRQAGEEYSLKWPNNENGAQNTAENTYSLDIIAQTALFPPIPITLVRLQIRVDNTPPDITLHPKSGRHISKNSNIEITINEQGNSPGSVTKVYATLDATQTIPIYQEPTPLTSTTGGTRRYQLSTENLQPGERKFVFYAEDEAGNVAQKEASYKMLQKDAIILEMSNHPNPFANSTTLCYSLAGQIDQCIFSIYDIRGALAYSTALTGDYLKKGEHQLSYNAKNSLGEKLAKGLYFWTIQIQSGEQHERKTHRIAVK